jgi:hypothetical protein
MRPRMLVGLKSDDYDFVCSIIKYKSVLHAYVHMHMLTLHGHDMYRRYQLLISANR